MPKFLTQDELYRLIQRELPEGTYPDGTPDAFYSTADSDATAKVLSTAYLNLSKIYDNFWPATADEKLPDWEKAVFGRELDASLTQEERQLRVVSKIRLRRSLSKPDMELLVASILGPLVDFEIVEWSSSEGTWLLGVSELGRNTVLAGHNMVRYAGSSSLCPLDQDSLGISDEELLVMQADAFTYELRVFNYTITAQELIDLELAMTEAEPARSAHVIRDNLTEDDRILEA